MHEHGSINGEFLHPSRVAGLEDGLTEVMKVSTFRISKADICQPACWWLRSIGLRLLLTVR